MEMALQLTTEQERNIEHELRCLFTDQCQNGNMINEAGFFGVLGEKPSFFEKAGKNVKATLSVGTRTDQSKGKTAWHKVEVQPFPEVQDFRKGDRFFVVGNPEYYRIKDCRAKSIKFNARFVERVELPWKE